MQPELTTDIRLGGVDRFFDAYLFDLDGTIYLGSELLPGAKLLIETLRERGSKTVFLSNNPTRDPDMYITKLEGLGIPVRRDEIINTVVSTVLWLKQNHPNAVVFPIAEEPLTRALLEAARADETQIAEQATGLYWGEPRLWPHVREMERWNVSR